MECINFFTQVTEKPMRRVGHWLSYSPTRRGFTGEVEVKGSIGCRDSEMVEFGILKGGRRVASKLTTLDFRRAESGIIKDLVGRVP